MYGWCAPHTNRSRRRGSSGGSCVPEGSSSSPSRTPMQQNILLIATRVIVTAVLSPPAVPQVKARRSAIVAQFKRRLSLAPPADFLAAHTGFVDETSAPQRGVPLYCVTPTEAIFVQCDPS